MILPFWDNMFFNLTSMIQNFFQSKALSQPKRIKLFLCFLNRDQANANAHFHLP